VIEQQTRKTKFLTQARALEKLTPGQARDALDETTWRKRHGIKKNSRSGEVARDLGYLLPGEPDEVARSSLHVKDKVGPSGQIRLGHALVHFVTVGICIALGLLAQAAFAIDHEVTRHVILGAILLFEYGVGFSRLEVTVSMPLLSRAAPILFWSFYSYIVYSVIADSLVVHKVEASLRPAAQQVLHLHGALLCACTVGIAAHYVWRGKSLVQSKRRACYFASFIREACDFSSASSSPEAPLDDLLGLFARSVEPNTWSRLQRLAFRRWKRLQTVTVAYLEPNSDKNFFDTRSLISIGPPEDFRSTTLETLKKEYHPAQFNEDWHKKNMDYVLYTQRLRGPAAVRAYRMQRLRARNVSLVGLAYNRRRAYHSRNVDECFVWDDSYIAKAAVADNTQLQWIDYQSALVAPVWNVRNLRSPPLGVLLVLRNLPHIMTNEDKWYTVTAARMLGHVLAARNLDTTPKT